MEHRYDKRFPSDHKTLIFKNGMPVAIGRIHNVSRGGIFVKTEIHLVEVNQSLDIELIARSGSRPALSGGERRLCKTLVMHKANDGIGLMLREDCAVTQRNFTEFFAQEFERHRSAVNTIHPSIMSQSIAAPSIVASQPEIAAFSDNHSLS